MTRRILREGISRVGRGPRFSEPRRDYSSRHTSPVYLSGKWDAPADARYFVDWIDDLITGDQLRANQYAQ